MIQAWNVWFIAEIAVLAGLFFTGIACARGRPTDRLVALEMASLLAVFALVLLTEGTNRKSFIDLGLTLAVLSIPGTLLYVHYLEEWR